MMWGTVAEFFHNRIDDIAARPSAQPGILIIVFISGLSASWLIIWCIYTAFRLFRLLGRKIAAKWRDVFAISPLAQAVIDALRNPALIRTVHDSRIQVWVPERDEVCGKTKLLEIGSYGCGGDLTGSDIMGTKLSDVALSDHEQYMIKVTARSVCKEIRQREANSASAALRVVLDQVNEHNLQ